MLFIAGLECLSHEEKASLLAVINSLTAPNVLSDFAQDRLKRAKDSMVRTASKLAGRVSLKAERNIKAAGKAFDWHPDVLRKRIDQEKKRLSCQSAGEVDREFRMKLVELSGLRVSKTGRGPHRPGAEETRYDSKTLARALLVRAAKSLNIDPDLCPDVALLERQVFESHVREQVEVLVKSLQDPAMQEQFEEILRSELSKLSESDREAIARTVGVGRVTAETLSALFRTAGSTAIAQLAVRSAGFGAFLFLTTVMKAFSLLIGITIPFSIYVWATSLLAFVLSPKFLLLTAAFAGSRGHRKLSETLEDQLAKTVILAGRAKLMEGKDAGVSPHPS